MADFYMSELVDNGSGGLMNGPSTLMVWNDVAELLACCDEQGFLMDGVIDDEEGRAAFIARLGVDDQHLWIVREGAVVERLDFAAFGDVVFADGTCVRGDRAEEIAALAGQIPGPLRLVFNEAALRAVAPPSAAPLPPDTWAPLRFAVPLPETLRTSMGRRVKLGFTELTGDTYWE